MSLLIAHALWRVPINLNHFNHNSNIGPFTFKSVSSAVKVTGPQFYRS